MTLTLEGFRRGQDPAYVYVDVAVVDSNGVVQLTLRGLSAHLPTRKVYGPRFAAGNDKFDYPVMVEHTSAFCEQVVSLAEKV